MRQAGPRARHRRAGAGGDQRQGPRGAGAKPAARARHRGTSAPAAEGAQFAHEVSAATHALRQRLAGLLQTQTLCRRYPAPTGRRIDTRRLGRIEAGEARLFRRERAGLQTDTAVQILIDRSGSMGSSRGRDRVGAPRPIEVARASCFATAMALAQLPGVAVAAAAFPGQGEARGRGHGAFRRARDRQAARFASLEAGGGTPLAEALLWGAAQLFAQRQARRILLVATDGAYDVELGRAMRTRLDGPASRPWASAFIATCQHLFVHSRRIVALGDLPQAMFDLLLEAIGRACFPERFSSGEAPRTKARPAPRGTATAPRYNLL